jgi:hypothetical protein
VRFKGLGRSAEFFYNVMLRQGVQQAFLSFFALGTLDRFPTLRLGVLEAGSGWIGAFLDRMDAIHDTISASGVALTMKPSDYFRRQCFISGDPDETAAPLTIEHVGADCFLWATDYPHPDHPSTWVRALERFVAARPGVPREVLGERGANLPALTPPAPLPAARRRGTFSFVWLKGSSFRLLCSSSVSWRSPTCGGGGPSHRRPPRSCRPSAGVRTGSRRSRRSAVRATPRTVMSAIV